MKRSTPSEMRWPTLKHATEWAWIQHDDSLAQCDKKGQKHKVTAYLTPYVITA